MSIDYLLGIAILIMVGASVYLVTNSILQFRRRPRLRYAEGVSTSDKLTSSFVKILKPLGYPLKPFSNLAYLKKLESQAEILKMNIDVQVMFVVEILLAATLGIFVFILLSNIGYGLTAAFFGFFVPYFIFLSKVRAKKEAIVRVFPETIDLIDLCIGAGLDFSSSIKWVIDKSDPNPFIEQLSVVLSEIQIGRNRTDALKDMARRLQLPDISSFVRTVVQSERMGTSAEEGFRNLSEDTRLTRFQSGERYAIKASLKILFPLLFCILPVIMIVVAGPIIIKFTQGDLIPKSGMGF